MSEINMSEVPSPPSSEDELTPEEQQELLGFISSGSFPQVQEKTGLVELFYKIFKAKDTTKASYLNEGELEAVRILQGTARYAEQQGLPDVAAYIKQKAEIILGTALSKEGFFIEKAVTTTKQLHTKSDKPTGGKKSIWGKKKG